MPLILPFVTPVTPATLDVVDSDDVGVDVRALAWTGFGDSRVFGLFSVVAVVGFGVSPETATDAAVVVVVVVVVACPATVVVVAAPTPTFALELVAVVVELTAVTVISLVSPTPVVDCSGCPAKLVIAINGFGCGCNGPCGEDSGFVNGCPAAFTI